MAIYGIGANFNKTDVSQYFINNNVAGIGWGIKDAPDLHQFIKSLKVGDIIYIKSYSPSAGLIIKAIGIVKDDDIINIIDEDIYETAKDIPESIEENYKTQKAINKTISKVLSKAGITLKTEIDHNLENGTAEFIDTGSTGRNTNIPKDGDFDYIMRLDKEIISNHVKANEVKSLLLEELGKDKAYEVQNDRIRLKDVEIEELDKLIDIDISFVQKTDRMDYSSDQALKDILNSIKKQHPREYSLVIANVIEAKKTLKEAGVYKKFEGGLGGIGIENWVLQNGGSFKDAATSFIEASKGKSLSEFQSTYPVWDFGENHYSTESGNYKYDNFITKLNETTYEKMQEALKNYLDKTKEKNTNNELNDMLNDNLAATKDTTVTK